MIRGEGLLLLVSITGAEAGSFAVICEVLDEVQFLFILAALPLAGSFESNGEVVPFFLALGEPMAAAKVAPCTVPR